ncbi:hypothetical protein ACFQY7_03150 [Actinomadura luteofluorescens]|uniref:hypothetical protein n=1 Tax=Actinomadura luteofluorescens TaxID=46163 RepID=UPI00362EB743
MALSEDAGRSEKAGREPREEAGVFSADREIGPDLAAVDWAATPLGPRTPGRRTCGRPSTSCSRPGSRCGWPGARS